MAEAMNYTSENKRYAVVTGANKGIGFGICKQLAANGIAVVLTARNEMRGAEALEKLKEYGLSDNVIFHQLDVLDPSSIASFAEFVKIRFGKLDILLFKYYYFNCGENNFNFCNSSFSDEQNAGIGGVIVDSEAIRASASTEKGEPQLDWDNVMTQTYNLAIECLETNYYGAKRMIEALLPLLQLADSPRIVNVSASIGKLKNIPNEWAKGVLSDPKSLTEESVDEVLNEFLKDFREGSLKVKGWPSYLSAYVVSKAAMNAYTRIAAKKYPTIKINCVCPGYVKTDINCNTGTLTIEDGAESPARLALLPDDGPSGLFFVRNEVSSFD